MLEHGIPCCAECGEMLPPGMREKATAVLKVYGRTYHFHVAHMPPGLVGGYVTTIDPARVGVTLDTSKWDKVLDNRP